MIFRDYTIVNAHIHSRRTYDTRDLAPSAVETCRRMLRLCQDRIEVPHGIEGMPAFTVRLGLPPSFSQAGAECMFTVQEPGRIPFQYNALLRNSTEWGDAVYGVTTVLALSYGGGQIPGDDLDTVEIERKVRPFYDARPSLLTALLPTCDDVDVIRIAADFSTCFAAAWLLESP